MAGQNDGQALGPAGVLLNDQAVAVGGNGGERFDHHAPGLTLGEQARDGAYEHLPRPEGAAGDAAGSYAALRTAASHMQMIADPLAAAIVQQFPEKFAR